MSKERDLLNKIVYRNNLGLMFEDLLVEAAIILNKPEAKPAVDAEYIAASIEFMESQKADDAKEMVRLRDWFAGLAMQSFITADNKFNLDSPDISDYAYTQADAMLKERSKGND